LTSAKDGSVVRLGGGSPADPAFGGAMDRAEVFFLTAAFTAMGALLSLAWLM